MFFLGYVPLAVLVGLAVALLLVTSRARLVVRLVTAAGPAWLAAVLLRDAATTTDSLGFLLWPPALLLGLVIVGCLVLGGGSPPEGDPPAATDG